MAHGCRPLSRKMVCQLIIDNVKEKIYKLPTPLEEDGLSTELKERVIMNDIGLPTPLEEDGLSTNLKEI